MTSFTKTFSSIIFSVIIGSTIIAMEKEATHTLMICDTGLIARYVTSSYHHHRQVPKNLPSTIKDPILQCIITNSADNTKSNALIAVKYLFNACATEPLLKLEINQHNRKDTLNIVARCIKNPKTDGDSFLTQLKDAMKPLYELSARSVFVVYTEQPDDMLFSADSNKDFLKAGIVVEKKEGNKTTWEHGQNGCQNEKALLQQQFTDVVQPKLPFITWLLNTYQCDQQPLPTEIKQHIATAVQLQPSTITIIK